jgi:nitrogen fixation NifU-like protein
VATPYGPKLLERFRHPQNRGSIRNATIKQEGTNPLCGDRVRIELLVEKGSVTDAKFTADACAICVAAADFLTDLVKRAPLDEVETLNVNDLLRLLDADIPPARLNCVRLPLTVMHGGVQLYKQGGNDSR